MITEIISEKYLEAVENIKNQSALTSIIDKLSDLDNTLKDKIFRIYDVISTGEPNRTHNIAKSFFSETMSSVNGILKSGKTSQIFINSHRMTESFSTYKNTSFNETSKAIEDFVSSLDNYLNDADIDSCKALIESASRLKKYFEKIEFANETFLTLRKPQSLPTFSIYTKDHTELDEFSSKLSAFTKIVEVSCYILKMSMSEAEVSIEKIESGSFFAKISANPLVIALVTAVITNGSQYILTNTTEKLDETIIKERSEALINILKIREALEKSGKPIPEIDTELKNAAVAITKQLNTLIGKSQAIEINKIEFKSSEKMLLASTQQTIEIAKEIEKD